MASLPDAVTRSWHSANTHFPEIIGSARGYELTGNATQKAIATNFFHILTAGEGQQWDPAAPGGHSFATGGSNAAEHWFNASFLGDSLMPIRWGNYRNIGARTEESCTQYNSLKVARHLFTWTADAKLADYYERALLNGIAGNQNVSGGRAVSLEYMLPMGGAPGPYEPNGIYKPWGSATDGGFPCCWGTLAESFAKLADSIVTPSANESARGIRPPLLHAAPLSTVRVCEGVRSNPHCNSTSGARTRAPCL